jgi:glutamine synthetase
MGRIKIRVPETSRMSMGSLSMPSKLGFSQQEDVLKYISENNIKILNLCHIPEEGRLKALSFSTMVKDRVQEILEYGERVDGSSLFSFIEPGKSDIYIMPRMNKTFVNPFSILPTLNILCDYLDEDGNPLDVAPQSVLARAENKLHSSSGMELRALAELEFYVTAKQADESLFQGTPDNNYHECSPFAKFEELRNEILATLDIVGIPTKYAHSEVGRVFEDDGTISEQHEIEFMPQKLPAMADAVAVSKWIVRNVCARHGVSASFIPKIDMNHAGSGMHIHLCGLKLRRNIVTDSHGNLSNEALRMIGGILKFAPSLAAFGNPTPVSYLRFIARKESPMHICWSARNRLALIRIPLWWKFRKKTAKTNICRETFEYRAPDAFANPHLLLAGLALATDYGLENSEESLEVAENLHAESLHEKARFDVLPRSCCEAAHNLLKDRKLYEANGVFPVKLIDKTAKRLEDYNDEGLWKELSGSPEQIQTLLTRYLHHA